MASFCLKSDPMPRFSVTKTEIEEVWKHIDTANHEMGEIRDSVSELKINVATIQNDVKWLKTYLPPLVTIITAIGVAAAYLLKT